MKLKIIAITMILGLCLTLSTACQSVEMVEQAPLYKSANVEVSYLDETKEINYINYEWALITDEIAYTKNTIIITGVASNVRQASVSYEYMDAEVSDNITIFDVEISDVLACRAGSVEQGDSVTVGVGYNMEKYGEGLPIIEDGTSYMMFCYVAADQEDDVLELAEYVDYWISAPKDLFLEKIGDFYLSIDYFSDMPKAVCLADNLKLSENQILSLSAIPISNNYAVSSYIDKEINESNLAEAAEALLVLRARTMENSTELWNLANRSYLINCSELEEYVRNAALAYNQ